jgi:hypothetical protein
LRSPQPVGYALTKERSTFTSQASARNPLDGDKSERAHFVAALHGSQGSEGGLNGAGKGEVLVLMIRRKSASGGS